MQSYSHNLPQQTAPTHLGLATTGTLDELNDNHSKCRCDSCRHPENLANLTTSANAHNITRDNQPPPVVYGELSILGYNGYIPNVERNGRKNKSKFLLSRRTEPNGIRKTRHYRVEQPQATKAIQDKDNYSISYTFSRAETIIVEYGQNEGTDMFQIGRSSEAPIDFVVMDTFTAPCPVSRGAKSHNATQSTISRFACRILVDRQPPYTARVYAAGFDSSRNIFLGEKATKWSQNNTIDGLTTNGVLLMHQKNDQGTGGVWREVSVDGGVYAIRESRSAAQKGTRILNENNILKDGTLIDLCGATLLWRSVEGFKASPTKKALEEKIDLLNASRPQCPVGLNTLVIPRKPILSNNHYHRHNYNTQHHHSHHQTKYQTSYNHIFANCEKTNSHQPYVYLKCGHVQGYHDWGISEQSNQRTCPICLSVGLVAKLSMGLEPSFYIDSGPLTHVFNPCGHMASEKTVNYWTSIKIPHGTHFFHSICPFCATPLATSEPASTKLIFQDDLD